MTTREEIEAGIEYAGNGDYDAGSVGILSAALRRALRALLCCEAANPYPDLSYQKYVDGFRFVEEQVKEAEADILKILRGEK